MWFKKKEKPTVICVGSCSQDVFFPTDEYVVVDTPEDITSKQKVGFEVGGKFRVDDRFEAIGGVAANIAIGLRRLGVKSAVVSHLGKDALSEWIIDSFREEGVVTEYLQIETGIKSDLSAIIVLKKTGERIIFHNRDANERLKVVPEELPSAPWYLVSALNGDWKENIKAVLAKVESENVSLAINPGQHNIKDDPNLIRSVLAKASVTVLNKDEAIEILLSQPGIDKARLDEEKYLLEQLWRNGTRIIGMTDGARGAWAFDGKSFWHCPIHTLSGVIDSTGAGDAFGSGFLAGIIQEKPIEEALRDGILNGGSVIGYYGAIKGLLSEEKMKMLRSSVRSSKLS